MRAAGPRAWSVRAAPSGRIEGLSGRLAGGFAIILRGMSPLVKLRPVAPADLPVFFAHQCDPVAVQLVGFQSRERDAFMAHWTNNVLGQPDNLARTILCDDVVTGNIGAWTDAESGERLVGYWLGREWWGRGIGSAATAEFLRVETTRPLTARVAKHNAGSRRVLEKNGFVCVGEGAFTLGDGTRLEEFVFVRSA